MNNESWNEKLTDSIIKLETQLNVNNKRDCIYSNVVNVIVNEMDKCINFKCIPKQPKKQLQNSKPYWSKEVKSLDRQRLIMKKNFEILEGKELVKID